MNLQFEVWFRFTLLLVYRASRFFELTLSVHTSSFWKDSISSFFQASKQPKTTRWKKKTIGCHTKILQSKTADRSHQAAEKLDETAVTQACLEFRDVWKADKNWGNKGCGPFRMGRDLELLASFLSVCWFPSQFSSEKGSLEGNPFICDGLFNSTVSAVQKLSSRI